MSVSHGWDGMMILDIILRFHKHAGVGGVEVAPSHDMMTL